MSHCPATPVPARLPLLPAVCLLTLLALPAACGPGGGPAAPEPTLRLLEAKDSTAAPPDTTTPPPDDGGGDGTNGNYQSPHV